MLKRRLRPQSMFSRRWVSYEVARPLLDKQSYVCLSDFGTSTSASEGSSIPGKTRGDAEAAARDDITGRQGNSGEVYEASDEPVNWEERRHVAADDGAQSALDRLGLVGDISVFLAGSVIPFKVPFFQLTIQVNSTKNGIICR